MIDNDLPTWVSAAFAQAKGLAQEANTLWTESIGDPGVLGGFQVYPGGEEDAVQFESVIYGGRSFVGTASEVRAAQRAYILSRAKRGKVAA